MKRSASDLGLRVVEATAQIIVTTRTSKGGRRYARVTQQVFWHKEICFCMHDPWRNLFSCESAECETYSVQVVPGDFIYFLSWSCCQQRKQLTAHTRVTADGNLNSFSSSAFGHLVILVILKFRSPVRKLRYCSAILLEA